MLGRRAAFQHGQRHARRPPASRRLRASARRARWPAPPPPGPCTGRDRSCRNRRRSGPTRSIPSSRPGRIMFLPADRERIELQQSAPVRPSRIRSRRWSATRHSRESRRPAPCWCRRRSRRPSCWRSDRPSIGLPSAAASVSPRMAAIGAGVGDDVHLDRGQRAVALGAELHPRRHLVARRRRGELFLARVFPLHRPAGGQRGEHAQVLGDHLLLAAEAAADAFGEDVQVAIGQPEQVRELLLHDERRLRAGAHMHAAVARRARRSSRASPDARAARARSSRSLRARRRPRRSRRPRCRSRRRCRHRRCRCAAEPLVVQHRRIRLHRRDRIEHRGQHLVRRRRAAGTPPRRSPSVSATTAATRCPTKRTTLSSM